MHQACRRRSKAAELDSWPRFHCDCRFLQIEKEHLVVRTRGCAGAGRYVLLHNVVSATPEKVDAPAVAAVCHYPSALQNVAWTRRRVAVGCREGVVTDGRGGIEASGGMKVC